MECVAKIEALLDKKIVTRYLDQNRVGDHICYISDLTKLRSHFPDWRITVSLDQILERMASAPV